jgi:hypothetical protein
MLDFMHALIRMAWRSEALAAPCFQALKYTGEQSTVSLTPDCVYAA